MNTLPYNDGVLVNSAAVPGTKTFSPYEDFVNSRVKKMGTLTEDMLHAAVGISGEAGELLDAIKKVWIYGKEIDRENIVEELGDLRFYMQAMMNVLDISEAEILMSNVAKLEKRYPNGYSNADAIARADKAEEGKVEGNGIFKLDYPGDPK